MQKSAVNTNRSSAVQQLAPVLETVTETTDWIGYVDPNEPRYCLCNQVRVI